MFLSPADPTAAGHGATPWTRNGQPEDDPARSRRLRSGGSSRSSYGRLAARIARSPDSWAWMCTPPMLTSVPNSLRSVRQPSRRRPSVARWNWNGSTE